MYNKTYEKIQKAKENNDVSAMGKLYRKNQKDLLIKFEYAKLLRLSGNKIESRKLLLEMLNTDNWTYASLELGKFEKEDGNIELARKYFKSLLHTRDKKYAIFEIGKIEKEQGNIELARQYFEQLVKEYKDVYAMMELGILEKEQGNIKKARQYFEMIRKLDNNNSFAIFELGKLEREIGNLKIARKYLESLLNEKNKDYAKLELGMLEKEDGNIEKARKYFESLLNTQNKDYAFKLLILLEFLEKNYILALKYINEALKQNIEINYDLIIFLGRELNVYFDVNYETMKYNYSMNQLLDYDEYCAIEHIVERHIKNDFNKKVDVYKLFNDAKNYLSDENKINKLNFNDLYLLRMDNIGAHNENYLFVVTLPHSKDIITMYPVKDKKSIIKYLDEDEKEHKNKLIKKDK